MVYSKSEAKDYMQKNMKGIWGATLTPFRTDYTIDEDGFRKNIRHCIDLQIDGLFINGLMGEAFHQTIAERKRLFKIAVDESNGKIATMLYTADPALENVLDMTRYAEEIAADYVIIINPKFYMGGFTEEGVYQYFQYVANRVNIGIALFNQMEHGYLMSPRLIARLAEIENIVAIKDIAPGYDIAEARRLCGDKILVSDAPESLWLQNLTVRGQQAMVATHEPFCLQSPKSKLVRAYTDLALNGEIGKAWEVNRQLELVRKAFGSVYIPGKWQASFKYWTQFLGMSGGDGRVRLPLMELTAAEKQAIETAVKSTELV